MLLFNNVTTSLLVVSYYESRVNINSLNPNISE